MATISKYQTTTGTTLYRVCYRTPDHRQTDKRGFATKRAAQAFAASVEVAKHKGEYISPSSARVTIGELGQAWLDRKRGHLKPSGYAPMETAWRTRVKPRWVRSQLATSGRLPCNSGFQTCVVAHQTPSRSVPRC